METIKNFTDAQRNIYNDWARRDMSKNEQKYNESMDSLFAMLKA